MAPERSPENPAKNVTAFRNLMEQRPTYEVLIAGKLDQLPVPDMADAIWSRIERQLDIDLPTNDGGTGPAPSTPSGPGAMGWGLSVLLVTLVTAFLLLKKEPKSRTPATQVSSPVIEQTTAPEQNSTGPPQPADRTRIAVPNTIRPEMPQAKNAETTPADSLTQQPVVSTAAPIKILDTLSTTTTPPLVTTPAKDSVQTGRKKRGVQGITPDDYRIVPAQKDSS
jgi:hypothetical protein